MDSKSSVSIAKFKSVCSELEVALLREKQAQNLLYQQSFQMVKFNDKKIKSQFILNDKIQKNRKTCLINLQNYHLMS